MIYGHLADMNYVLRLEKPLESFEGESVLIQGPRIKVLLARSEIFLDTFGERWSGQGVRLDLRHQGRPQRLRSFQVRELRALARDDIAGRRATMNPDWALTVHPKTAFALWDTALLDGATLEVSLVQNEAFYGLGHPFSVRVLVHSVKLL
jgi:hypothetical protein